MSSSAARNLRTPPAPGPGRPRTPARPPLRVVPRRANQAAKAPFVVLVVALLGGGLVGLLLLNTALAQGSFTVDDLKQRNTALADHQQEVQRQVARLSSPQVLSRRARQLGMVSGGTPAFVDPRDGAVRGQPTPAAAAPTHATPRGGSDSRLRGTR